MPSRSRSCKCQPTHRSSRAVIDELTTDQLRSVQRVVDQQEVFARATLRDGVPGVVTALSQALSATAVVVGTDGRPLAATGRDTEHIIAITAEAARNMRPHSGRRHASRVVADGAGYLTIQTVCAALTARGCLAVRSHVALSASDRLLVAHALSLIAIELEKPAKVIDAEQRLRTAVTLGLLSEPRSIEPGVLRYFGFDPESDVVLVVLTNVGALLPADAHVTDMLGGGDIPYLMGSIDDEIVIILPGEHAAIGRDIYRRLGAQLARQLGGGQSSPASLGDLDFSLRQARAAARRTPTVDSANPTTSMCLECCWASEIGANWNFLHTHLGPSRARARIGRCSTRWKPSSVVIAR